MMKPERQGRPGSEGLAKWFTSNLWTVLTQCFRLHTLFSKNQNLSVPPPERNVCALIKELHVSTHKLYTVLLCKYSPATRDMHTACKC